MPGYGRIVSARLRGGRLISRRCPRSGEAHDGRSTFEVQSNNQLKMPRMGNICVTLSAGGPDIVVQDCQEASQTADARDKFFLCVPLHLALCLSTALPNIAQILSPLQQGGACMGCGGFLWIPMDLRAFGCWRSGAVRYWRGGGPASLSPSFSLASGLCPLYPYVADLSSALARLYHYISASNQNLHVLAGIRLGGVTFIFACGGGGVRCVASCRRPSRGALGFLLGACCPGGRRGRRQASQMGRGRRIDYDEQLPSVALPAAAVLCVRGRRCPNLIRVSDRMLICQLSGAVGVGRPSDVQAWR